MANRKLFRSRVPVEPGGGTVIYPSPWDWGYTDDVKNREEGGTPNVVGVIRAGLAIELKEILTTERIERVEHRLMQRAIERFKSIPEMTVLGAPGAPRIVSFVSFVIDEGRLHYNLATRLLSDRWGIQTRGGCMCAGT